MTTKDDMSFQSSDPRRQAEAIARENPALSLESIHAMSAEEIQQRFHELRVHQIELEMQNKERRAAQAKIEAERARYFDLYDLAPVGYCTLSELGFILEANLTATSMLGLARSELVTHPFSRFIHSDDQHIYSLHRKQLFETGTLQKCDLRLVKPDGSYIWAHLKKTVVQAEDGAPLCRVVLSDISGRIRAEKQREILAHKYAAVVASTSDGVLAVNMDGRITVFNPGAEKLFGCTADEALGSPVTRFCPEDLLGEQAEIIRHVLNTGAVTGYDSERLTVDGRRIPVEITLSRNTDDQGGPLGVSAILRNIIERKQAEKALIESEALFRGMFNNHSAVMLLIDPTTGQIVKANQAASQFYGYPLEKLIQMNIQQLNVLSPAEIAEKMADAFNKQVNIFEFRHMLADGQVRDVQVHSAPVTIQNQILLFSIIQDITERRRAEYAVTRSVEDGGILLNTIQTQIWYLTDDHTYGAVNKAHAEFNGLKIEDMAFKNMYDFFLEDVVEVCRQSNVEVFTTAKPVHSEEWVPHFSGERRLISIQKTPKLRADGTVEYVVCAAEDITERKRAEEALRKSERFLNATIDGLTAHITVLDDKGEIILTNKAYRDFAAQNGIEPRTVSEGAHYLAVCDTAAGKNSEEATPFAEGIRDVLSGKRRSFKLEYPCHSPSEDRWFIAHVTPFDGEDPHLVIVAHENITERKRAEEALREQRDFSESLIETAQVIILVLDTQGRIVRFNPYMEKLVGYDLDEVKGRDWFETFLTPENSRTIKPLFQKAVEDIQTHGNVNPIITKDGRTILVEWNDKTLKDKEGRTVGLLAIGQDITRRKQAEETREKLQAQLIRTQKAESLGRMAGAIAHIFNNQLGVVLGNLEMVIEDLPRDAKPVSKLNAAMQGARKAAEVSGLMLTYLGQTTGLHVPLDLSESCRRILPSLRAGTSRGIVLNVNLPSPGPIVKANTNQIQQMLTNLVTNAYDAIGEKQGTVTLTVKTVPQTDISEVHRYPADWQAENAAYACLEVTDTGCGIASEAIDKIFDPFYSTKFTGRGLSLPVVSGIVRAHDGVIMVASKEHGTTFRVFLPLSAEEIPRQQIISAQPTAKEGGSSTVLIIEDEEMIRDMAKTMITRLGYTVLAAKDGIEAMEMFARHQDEICCVVSDVTMPRMNGWQTLAALRKLSPGIPVILCSGNDEAQVLIGDHPERPQAFLHKPYQKVELQAALAKAMTG